MGNSVEQNAIKMIIEPYFESRYCSLNTLKLENFESLVEKSSKGTTFLRSESDKPEVEIQHAKLNHLGYAHSEFFLDFKDISIDTTKQTAVVSVIEGHDVVFEIFEEISMRQSVVSSIQNLKLIIVLREDEGIWKIVSDDYDDYLWCLIKAKGLSKDELLQSLAVSQSPIPDKKGMQETTTCSLPSDEIPDRFAEISGDQTVGVFCYAGTRSTIVYLLYLRFLSYKNVRMPPAIKMQLPASLCQENYTRQFSNRRNDQRENKRR